MLRMSLAAAAALALAAPAFAEPAQTGGPANSVVNATLAQQSGELQARQHLVRQGYVNISPLEKDVNGRWTGTALKDGKTVLVAIDLRAIPAGAKN